MYLLAKNKSALRIHWPKALLILYVESNLLFKYFNLMTLRQKYKIYVKSSMTFQDIFFFFFTIYSKKMLDYFSKHIGRYLKYMLLAYALISITYITARFCHITGPPHARTRRSVIEPITQEKEAFFFAPLDQESIEQDEQELLESIIYYDQMQSSQRNLDGIIVINSKNSFLVTLCVIQHQALT